MTSPTALIFLNLFCVFVGVLSNTKSIIIPCKKTDELCMAKSANIAIPLLADGIPSLNIEPIDPVPLSDIEGEISNIKYKFKDVVANNYSKCTISDLKFNLNALTLSFDLNCPSLIFNGYLEVTGEILKSSVEGNGHFKLIFGKYINKIEAIIEKVKGSNGKMHMAIKLSKVLGGPLEPVQIFYKLITKENLSPEAANKSDEEKLKSLLETATPPFAHNIFENVFIIVNKYLATIPFDKLFIE